MSTNELGMIVGYGENRMHSVSMHGLRYVRVNIRSSHGSDRPRPILYEKLIERKMEHFILASVMDALILNYKT